MSINTLLYTELVLVLLFIGCVILYLVTGCEIFSTIGIVAFIGLCVIGVIIHVFMNIAFIEYLQSAAAVAMT